MISNRLHEKYSNYRYCIVRECKNTSIKTPKKMWIKLPSETNIRNTWLRLAERDPESLSTSSQIYLCEDHFDLQNDMDNYMEYKIMGSVKRIRMKPGCIPSKLYTQDNKIREHSPALDLPEDAEEEEKDQNPTACTMEISPKFVQEMCSSTTTSTFISPNICRCCHSFGFYTDISAEFNPLEGNQTYEEVLKQTFNIQVSSINKGTVQSSRQICDECINKLQEAYVFRNMVIENESKMLEHFEMIQNENLNTINGLEHTVIKTELHIKEECINDEFMEDEVVEANSDDDLNIKGGHEDYVEDEVSESSISQLNTYQDKPETHEENNLTKLFETKGPGRILRQNSLRLLENSTMFPFQFNKCRYLCFVCKQQFIDMATLREHNLTHSEENLEKIIIRQNNNMVKVEISMLNCKKCGENVQSLDDLREHLGKEHRVLFPVKESLLIPFKIENEGLKCQICSELFHSFRVLNIHTNKHYKNHICDVCGTSFTNLVFLNLHKTRSHRKYACTDCNIHFESATDKKRHDVDKHNAVIEKKMRFVCWHCKERFSQENLKIQHLVDKHGLSKPDYKCQLCAKGFITKSLCNNHVKNVHLKEKKHECDVCNKFFYTKSDLMRHRVTHTGEKRFSCALCNTAFATKDSLRRHIKRSHN